MSQAGRIRRQVPAGRDIVFLPLDVLGIDSQGRVHEDLIEEAFKRSPDKGLLVMVL